MCLISDAQKNAEVARIQYDQKIMEKESLKKMSLLEGNLLVLKSFGEVSYFLLFLKKSFL